MPLDPIGNLSVALSITSLFLLILGLPLVTGTTNIKNLIRHGYLTIVALALQTVLVFIIMIPSFATNLSSIIALSPLSATDAWVHIILGAIAEVSGFAYITLWLWYSTSNMRCYKAKKYMMPTFVMWIIAIISGVVIHVLQLF